MGGLGCKNPTNSCVKYDVKFTTDIDLNGQDLNEFGQPIEFETKHERMVHKLKNLKKRALQIHDFESVKDIDWYLIYCLLSGF